MKKSTGKPLLGLVRDKNPRQSSLGSEGKKKSTGKPLLGFVRDKISTGKLLPGICRSGTENPRHIRCQGSTGSGKSPGNQSTKDRIAICRFCII
jgi:hypothetical protein